MSIDRSHRVGKINTSKKLLYGYGICDVYVGTCGKGGPGEHNKAYGIWRGMLRRCYATETLSKPQPTYLGCTVHEEWHKFSNFKMFFNQYYRDGYHLDKDILIPGNKIYGPQTCLFVPAWLNAMFAHRSRKGDKGLPVGVSSANRCHGYWSSMTIGDGKMERYLGYFDTPEEAHSVWVRERMLYGTQRLSSALASGEIDLRVYDAAMDALRQKYRMIDNENKGAHNVAGVNHRGQRSVPL